MQQSCNHYNRLKRSRLAVLLAAIIEYLPGFLQRIGSRTLTHK